MMVGLIGLTSLNRQHVLRSCNGDLILGEPRDRKSYLIGVLAGTLDIVGRVVLLAGDTGCVILKHVKKAIEPNGGPPERRKVIVRHSHILLRATWTVKPSISVSPHPSGPFGRRSDTIRRITR